MAGDTRDRIVNTARQLFWEQGFEATSLAQISTSSGANAGSIYYFFKSKREILEAVLAHYERQLGSWLIDPVFARTDHPRERIFGVIDTYRSFLVETNFTLGCPVGGLAVELPDELTEARARIGRIFEALVEALRGCAAELTAGIAPGAPSPDQLASLVMTVIEGGIVQARAARDIGPFDRSVECLADYLDRIADPQSQPSQRPIRG